MNSSINSTGENGHKIAYDPRDISERAERSKQPKLTLMEEVLLLGLKDQQVCLGQDKALETLHIRSPFQQLFLALNFRLAVGFMAVLSICLQGACMKLTMSFFGVRVWKHYSMMMISMGNTGLLVILE